MYISGEIACGFNVSFQVGRIDPSSRDMRSVAGEKFVLLSFVFLYSKRPTKGSVFADFTLVNMRLHIFTHASENPFPWLWCGDDVTCSKSQPIANCAYSSDLNQYRDQTWFFMH